MTSTETTNSTDRLAEIKARADVYWLITEVDRLRSALVTIECAAERAERKGYDLDIDEVLDQTRLALGSAEPAKATS